MSHVYFFKALSSKGLIDARLQFGNHDKAAHYIQALDQARCEGRWQEIPELVRKLQKHAPARKCEQEPPASFLAVPC